MHVRCLSDQDSCVKNILTNFCCGNLILKRCLIQYFWTFQEQIVHIAMSMVFCLDRDIVPTDFSYRFGELCMKTELDENNFLKIRRQMTLLCLGNWASYWLWQKYRTIKHFNRFNSKTEWRGAEKSNCAIFTNSRADNCGSVLACF